ncbi:MAG: polysaccharide biosynthesis protein [Patescibacteria group bacterium]
MQNQADMIYGKRILITGGTGSFGKMFIREILNYSPKEIVVFSRDEVKQGTMRLEYKNEKRLRFILGDIRDYRSVREAIRGVDIIIHAAALKWITEVEYNVWDGIKTNILGAQNIIEAAREESVEKVVALSTDKAVEPINAYGMTKALQERLITTANLYTTNAKTVFVSTRCGNVLGSRGSVVPLFKSLIGDFKPITITDSKMTRFMLTLKESVELVLTALKEGVGGEVFVKKMSAHTIADLADAMLSNIPKSKVNIVNIGIRAGEKIHETLISSSESIRTVEIGNYFVILPQIETSIITNKYKDLVRLDELHYSSATAKRLGKDELVQILKAEGWF